MCLGILKIIISKILLAFYAPNIIYPLIYHSLCACIKSQKSVGLLCKLTHGFIRLLCLYYNSPICICIFILFLAASQDYLIISTRLWINCLTIFVIYLTLDTLPTPLMFFVGPFNFYIF